MVPGVWLLGRTRSGISLGVDMGQIVAIIPARGGSKRIPRKNLVEVFGVPLVGHSIRHARQSELVDRVIVSTDDLQIAAVSRQYGADVFMRPNEISRDEDSSEAALLHALDRYREADGEDPKLVVFLQCTSVVRRPGEIDSAIRRLRKCGADSLFSACRFNKLIWRDFFVPCAVNHDPDYRLMEQSFNGQIMENGSIYVFKPEILREHNNRLGGKIAVHRMHPLDSYQIDEPADVAIAEAILAHGRSFNVKIKLLVLDFDGVMTDNTVIVHPDGTESVVCNRGDGLGLSKLGVETIVLSTEEDRIVSTRCAKLGIKCYQGVGDKASWLRGYLSDRNIDPGDVAYLGNDVNDKGCLEMVGLAVVPADAHPSVRHVAHWVLRSPGGRGAVRELCDLL